ncbi:MAG: family 78 glycoside hydrolase catalytic domain, partial [Clostridia bacterium]|nr:family 78 glycoside hydrolase catalytic domain [Clostridia bacterium]
MPLSQAKWIWLNNTPEPNEYAVFSDRFTADGIAPVTVYVAAETDYVLEINGQVAGFGQFAGYPFEKYYDTLDVSAFCHAGENEISLTVRYEGFNSATHIDDGAGVIFAVFVGENAAVYSGTHTKGSLDDRYQQHDTRKITVQLGLTSGMCSGSGKATGTCVEIARDCRLLPRPVGLLQIDPFLAAKRMDTEGEIYDLGRQNAGYLRLTIRSDGECAVKVTYGEHLADGNVRHRIHHRDFSLDFTASGGTQTFTQYFVRIAGRYLQVYHPQNAEIVEIGILPALYPQIEKPHSFSGLDGEIYDTCVRTLRLCMHTHYEDTPWREQALYVLDSRNQMLCGYYAFAETAFQRANLVFIAKGKRPDGLLELTYPAINTPAIPFFSVMYPATVWEYVRHTGDTSILAE